MLWLLQFLPRKTISRIIGVLMHIRGPRFVPRFSIRIFAWFYNINVDEAEKSVGEYNSIGEFFSRRLRKGLRPISTSWAVHPCDARILQHGTIDEGTLIQAKG